MKRALGNLERQLFAYARMRRLRTLRTRDLTEPLGTSDKQERELLNRLAQAGLTAQVRRGLHLIPPRLPLGGKWGPEEALAAWPPGRNNQHRGGPSRAAAEPRD
jgi:hypothetical protein